MPETDAVANAIVTGGSADNPNAATQHNQSGVDWIPDEYKDTIKAKGWKSPADMLKSYVELEKFSSKAYQDMSDEEREKILKRLGRTEKPEELELSNLALPDEFPKSKEADAEFKEIVWKMQRMPLKEQAKYLHEWATKKAVDGFVAARTTAKTRREEQQSKLRQLWGADSDKNRTAVNQLVALGGEELVQWINNGHIDDPVLLNGLHKISKLLADETLVSGRVASGTNSSPPGTIVDFSKSPELQGDNRYGKRG